MRKPHTSALGRRMDSTWKVINTQVPVTLTVAPALRKGTQTSKERVRTIPEQPQPQPDSPQKAVALVTHGAQEEHVQVMLSVCDLRM